MKSNVEKLLKILRKKGFEFIKENYKNKKIGKKVISDLLEEAANAYYNTDEIIITDFEFDQLQSLINFKKVGSRSKLNLTVKHLYPNLAGTVQKLTLNEVEKECKKYFEISNGSSINLSASLKEDGNSVIINYKNGKVISALTRGRNDIGGDVTDLFKEGFELSFKKDDPLGYFLKESFGIKFEAIMDEEMFKKFNEKNNFKFSSPRSTVAGILSNKETLKNENYRYIQLVPLNVEFENKEIEKNWELMKENFLERAFEGNPRIVKKYYETIIAKNYKELAIKIIEFFKKCNEKVKNNEFHRLADGTVFSVKNAEVQKAMGRLDNRNKYEFCLKFPPREQVTVVEDIKFYIGKFSTVTPVVIFKPIVFFGNTCTHVSISNYKRFKELNLAKGDSILIAYRNDVLCYLEKKLASSGNPPIKFITKCPLCGSNLKKSKTGVFALCVNDECPSYKIGKIENFLIKAGIKDIREFTIKSLFKAKLINEPSDLFKPDFPEKFREIEMEGFGKKLKDNIITTLEKYKREIIDPQYIFSALGIRGMSTKMFGILLNKYNLDELEKILEGKYIDLYRKLINIEGFKEKRIKMLYVGFNKYKEEYYRLKKYLKLKTETKVESNLNKLFCTTGFRPSLEFIIEMKNKGYLYNESINKKVDILFYKGSRESNKIKRALRYGIKIEEYTGA